ncbi:MAG: GNAT family N-acetyltransferase [Alphaproteobacteria bacterium]
MIDLLAHHPTLVPEIAKLYLPDWRTRHPGMDLDQAIKKLHEGMSKTTPPIRLVAIENNQPIGTAELRLREHPAYPQREFWLGGVFVAEHARGRGVASDLSYEVTKLARKLGIAQLSLQTVQLDGGLYKKLGWQPVEQTTSPPNSKMGATVLIMEHAT